MNQPAPLGQRHDHFAVRARLLVGDRQQTPPIRQPPLHHRHGNPHGSAVGTVHPRVIRNGKHQLNPGRRVGGQGSVNRRLHDAPVKGLAQAVGGDQPHALGLPGGHQRRRAGPPIHHKVGRLGHLRPGRAQGLHITVAQRRAHGRSANKRRVTHHKISLRPHRLARADVAPLRHLR